MHRHKHAHTNTCMSKHVVPDPGIHVATHTHACMYTYAQTEYTCKHKEMCAHKLTYRPAFGGGAAGGRGGQPPLRGLNLWQKAHPSLPQNKSERAKTQSEAWPDHFSLLSSKQPQPPEILLSKDKSIPVALPPSVAKCRD